MDFKKTFISLTEHTIPYLYEETIEHLLPKDIKKDGFGNYCITIGKGSTTLFTCHLDTASKIEMKINHVIENNIIRTDGTTILGADNKAGVCILMYLIERKVSGTYYFFIGEEVGCLGSRWALNNNPDYFRQFKRAVAFDRQAKGSIITNQRNGICTSDEFAKALSNEYKRNGMEFNPDPNGIFTDTAVFVNVIPECTNISSGTYNEHTNDEYVDIRYCEQVAKASAQIDWENLPAVRDLYNMRYIKKFR